jgi:hypothetical protein
VGVPQTGNLKGNPCWLLAAHSRRKLFEQYFTRSGFPQGSPSAHRAVNALEVLRAAVPRKKGSVRLAEPKRSSVSNKTVNAPIAASAVDRAGRPHQEPCNNMPDPNAIPLFRCSRCFALYQVTAQADSDKHDLKIICQVCNEPLAARKGQFVLKYLLLRKATPLDVRRARHGFLRTKPTASTRSHSVPSPKEPRR